MVALQNRRALCRAKFISHGVNVVLAPVCPALPRDSPELSRRVCLSITLYSCRVPSHANCSLANFS